MAICKGFKLNTDDGETIYEFGGASIEGYKEVAHKLEALRRRVAAHSAAIVKTVKKNGLFSSYKPVNKDDHPSLKDYTGETHLFVKQANYPTDSPVEGVGGYVDSFFVSSSSVGGQFFYPVSSYSKAWQIWYTPRRLNSTRLEWGDPQCINGVDETQLDWLKEDDD